MPDTSELFTNVYASSLDAEVILELFVSVPFFSLKFSYFGVKFVLCCSRLARTGKMGRQFSSELKALHTCTNLYISY